MIVEITALKNCDVDSKRFRYWVLFSTNLTDSKRKNKQKIRKFLTELLGPENIRWQLQGAGEQYILKLEEARDYTFLLLKIPRS
jgi:hypothetical protein